MRCFVAFLVYFLGCLLLSALLQPIVHPLLETAIGASATPSRSLYRFAMLLMLIGFPWLLKSQDLFSWRRVGFALPARAAWAAVFKGLGIGVVMLALLVAGLLATGARFISPPDDLAVGDLLGVILAGLLGGFLVGLVEEIFFRGMLHTGTRRTLAFWPTALLVGAFYAGVHFMRPGELPAGSEVDLTSSLGMLWDGLSNLAAVEHIHDSFVALLIAGVLLAMVRERSGNILWCIGIHAGWVLVIKVTKYLTDTDTAQGHPIWVGHYDNVTGWLAALWLALIAAGFWYASRPRR